MSKTVFFLWNVVECHSIERKFSIKVHETCTWVQYLSKSNTHSDAQSTERLKDTLTCPACQYEICLPRRFFLPDKCSHWQLVFYTHTSTHTPFGYCLSLSSVPPHNGHTPNRIFSTENVFTGKRSFCPHTTLQYCRCIIDVFFLFFSGLSLYCYNTTIIAPMGFSLTWFIFLHSKINSPSPVWKTLFLVSVKIASLPLLTTNLSSQVWQLAVRLSAVFRFPPAVPAHAYIRFHAKIMLHLFIFQFHFQLSVSCAEKGLLQWRGRRDGKAKQRLTTCAQTSPPSHYSHQTSLNKIIFSLLIQPIVYHTTLGNNHAYHSQQTDLRGLWEHISTPHP